MSESKKVTVKRNISPVTLTVEFTATKVNENHNFFGLSGKVVKSSLPNSNPIKVSILPMNGSMYLQVTNADGINYLTTLEAAAKAEKSKLF